MKNYEFESIKNEFLDIYAAICNLTEDEILNGPEDIFHPHFERLQHLIARKVDDHLADQLLCDRQLRPVVAGSLLTSQLKSIVPVLPSTADAGAESIDRG